MVFNSFRLKILIRIILLGVSITAVVYLFTEQKFLSTGVIGLVIVAQLAELVYYVERTNRKLTRFLESVRYSDFVSGHSMDNELGKSFKDLNQAFNEVLEAFRKARTEKEEHWQYLNTVVQQVGTGLISFNKEGEVQLINNVAKGFIRAPQIHNINELKSSSPKLHELFVNITPGSNQLHQADAKTQLAMHATEIIIGKEEFKLITLQNIQYQLEQKEIEAWQNLTRVLRHEIMNSITPIASLTSTLKDILVEDLKSNGKNFELGTDTVDDLQEGLDTIEGRSKGLIKFIDAYRDYTSIPQPQLSEIKIAELLDHISNLLKVEIRQSGVNVDFVVDPNHLTIKADEEQMEQVLINMIKNALEALTESESPLVSVLANLSSDGQVVIKIRDNGQGIIPEAKDRIFIPFYTTKKTGSGIGLALSRQIMQMHNGSLEVDSVPDEFTEFTLKFA